MENYKEQIESLRKQIDQLEQQMNKPTIEVGKVYRDKGHSCLYYVTGLESAFGFNIYKGFVHENNLSFETNKSNWEDATTKEWVAALTKYADELYKDCDRVDRTGLDIKYTNVFKFNKGILPNFFDYEGFYYNGAFVMDKHGFWAKGIKAEPKEMYINIYKNTESYPLNSLEEAKKMARTKLEHFVGTFKLVRVD